MILNPFKWWRRRRREIDKRILFPAIREMSISREQFDLAVWRHISIDEAWHWPAEYRDDADMKDQLQRIRDLKPIGCLL